MSTGPKVLVFSDYYLPGYRAGGPIRSLEALIEHLKDQIEFKIITRNHDFKAKSRYPIENAREVQVGSAKVEYYADSLSLIASFTKQLAVSQASVLYLNSFFSFYYSILPLILCRLFFRGKFKILLAPRGELSVGALSLKSFKKRLYLTISRFLYKKINWQITHESERAVIQQLFGSTAVIYLAPNLQLLQDNAGPELAKKSGQLKILFLSRLSVKKNLHYALEVLKNCNSGDIELDIYGSIEDSGYWQTLKTLMQELPSQIRVEYKGEVFPSDVLKLMTNYHLFFLPTLGENYGHAIIEALRSGCMVLSSDQIPWLELEKKACGWNIPLAQKERYEKVLNQLIAMDNNDFLAARNSARQYGLECLCLNKAVSENLTMFNSLFT